MKHLLLEDMKMPKPDFDSSKATKCQVISLWLIDWIKHALEYGIADIGDFLPPKETMADFFNVSCATVQNAIRYVKNLGYLSSKQSRGTCIADFYSKDIKPQDELFHGNIAEYKIKKIVLENKIQTGDIIPSVKSIALETQISQNTIRNALSSFAVKGNLEKKRMKGNKYCWVYIKPFEITPQEINNFEKDESLTLTKQLIKKIKNYLEKTYKNGDKILPNMTFAKMFDVSIKTVNDAMKVLNSKGIILSRRGKYGTIYLGGSENPKRDFISSEKKKLKINYSYSWQKTLEQLKKYIAESYEAGDKLPSIRKLSEILNVSANTTRRALKELVKSGNLVAKTGKSGGMLIIEMPESEGESYRWLALNPKFIK